MSSAHRGAWQKEAHSLTSVGLALPLAGSPLTRSQLVIPLLVSELGCPGFHSSPGNPVFSTSLEQLGH